MPLNAGTSPSVQIKKLRNSRTRGQQDAGDADKKS